MAVAAAIDAGAIDQGIRGVEPEPVGGFRSVAGRDRALEAFCAAVWERHEVRGHRPNPRMWPTTGSFHSNWPLLAEDLIVGNWKIAGTASLEETAEVDLDMLDPPAVAERDWREVFAAELAANPVILEDLERGGGVDGTELVLERAALTVGERAVVRGWLMGDDAPTIAAAVGWRRQTVDTLLRNGLYRLGDVARWSKRRHLGRTRIPGSGAAADRLG